MTSNSTITKNVSKRRTSISSSFSDFKNRTLHLGNFSQKLLFLAVLATSFAFNGNAQQISIGMPVDGTEGTSDVSFKVFIEGGGTNNTGAPITGTIQYDGLANINSDYLAPLNFSIPNGVDTIVIIATVIDDLVSEPTESVIATLIGVPSTGMYANTTSTAYINDNDAGQIFVSIGNPIAGSENGSNASFDVYLEGGVINTTGSDIYGAISYSGTASTGTDFTSVAVFAILIGTGSTTITLPIVDDACIENDETIIATISFVSVGAIANASSTATILDDDLATTAISIHGPIDGEEGGSNVFFVVSIDAGLINCTGVPITGAFTFGGTASEGADYLGAATFSIPNGNSFILIEFPVFDDLQLEQTESVVATISNPSVGVVSPANGTSIAYIVDNDFVSDLNEINLNLSVSIFPNPVNSTLNISSEQQMENYSITDLNGRIMKKGTLNTKISAVNVELLPKGCYFVNITLTDGNTVIKKVLKH